MAYYEPGSGWNLPPGCFDGDPNAPWNRVDEPACGDCAHCIEGCCDYGICELEFEEAFSAQEAKEPMAAWEAAKWARDWIVEHYKDIAGGLVQTVRWIAASCVALLVAVVALELYVIRTLAAGLVVLALLACG